MDQMTWTELGTLVGMAVIIYKTFFSKNEKALQNTQIKQGRAEEIKTYEEAAALNLKTRTDLEKQMSEMRAEFDKKLSALEEQIKRRDAVIDCLEESYRGLAQKAIAAGVPAVELNPPCFAEDQKRRRRRKKKENET